MSGTPKVTRLPVGTAAVVTALYAALYLVWEQSHWSAATPRDLTGASTWGRQLMRLSPGVL